MSVKIETNFEICYMMTFSLIFIDCLIKVMRVQNIKVRFNYDRIKIQIEAIGMSYSIKP